MGQRHESAKRKRARNVASEDRLVSSTIADMEDRKKPAKKPKQQSQREGEGVAHPTSTGAADDDNVETSTAGTTRTHSSTTVDKSNVGEEDPIGTNPENDLSSDIIVGDNQRPKSKKELRNEKKRTRKVLDDPDFAMTLEQVQQRALDKQKDREEFKRIIRDERNMTKLRQLKKHHREQNAPGGASRGAAGGGGEGATKSPSTSTTTLHKHKEAGNGSSMDNNNKKKAKKKAVEGKNEPEQEEDVARKIINEIKHGTSDSSGWTTVSLGVKYKDIVIGKGPIIPNKCLLTVKYQLTGGKFKTAIDSSKKFTFRLGKGEVVQGWEIGLQGIREGGQRQLIIPPKAGYGSKDIGAGVGGLLYFDVTVLSFR